MYHNPGRFRGRPWGLAGGLGRDSGSLLERLDDAWQGARRKNMGRFGAFLLLLVVLLIGGGAAALLFVDIPPPSKQVEKVLPDDRFPR